MGPGPRGPSLHQTWIILAHRDVQRSWMNLSSRQMREFGTNNRPPVLRNEDEDGEADEDGEDSKNEPEQGKGGKLYRAPRQGAYDDDDAPRLGVPNVEAQV